MPQDTGQQLSPDGHDYEFLLHLWGAISNEFIPIIIIIIILCM